MNFEKLITIADAITASPAAGLTVGTEVLTTAGLLPVQFLAPGDRVITRAGATPLQAIDVHLLRDAQMLRIRASALGHDRPDCDWFLSPSQKILLRDGRARLLWGRSAALVEAERLVDGDFIRAEIVQEIRIFSLRFESAQVIRVCGMDLICESADATT